MNKGNYLQLLADCGGHYTVVPRQECSALLQSWREVYAAGMFAATGRWSMGGLEWHVFSFEHAKALCGEPALAAYREELPEEVILFPQTSRELPVVRLSAERLPELRALSARCLDVLVWPEDRSWTMAFTHEESLGLGPYFSRREWLAAPSRETR